MARSRSSKSGGRVKGYAKKQSLMGKIKGSISSRQNKGDPSSRVGSGGAQRSRNIMDQVDKAQSGK